MLRHVIVVSTLWICVTRMVSAQESASIPGAGVVLVRQASMDMSSITLRWMVDSMKAGRDAQSQSYPAAALAKWAQALPSMFPAGTGKGETSVSTQARVLIWRDKSGFDRAAKTYADVTVRLTALSMTNDTAGFTSQLTEVDHACKACHAGYKEGAQGPPSK